MLHLLNTTGERLEVNALFIQPTRWCANNCKGCYVKAHEMEKYHTPAAEQVELFRHFYSGEKAHANQITISLDTMPSDQYANMGMTAPAPNLILGYKPDWQAQRQHMQDFFVGIYNIINEEKRTLSPQVHLTVRDINSLREYADLIRSIVPLECMNIFTVISISEIEDPDTVRERLTTHINYNHMCPTDMNSTNLKEQVEELTYIGKTVNSIYMIMHKRPLGLERNDLTKMIDRSRWRSDILYMKTMLESLPSNIRNKVQIDGCLQDVVRGHETSLGCSSSVSRFQVWPDGSVSGCPYAFKGSTGQGRTAKDILENIRQARKTYDYDRCYLPEIHRSLLGRPTDLK